MWMERSCETHKLYIVKNTLNINENILYREHYIELCVSVMLAYTLK